MENRYKYKYNVINSQGDEEAFTGEFHSIEQRDKWMNTHGKWWQKQGKKFVLKRIEKKLVQ